MDVFDEEHYRRILWDMNIPRHVIRIIELNKNISEICSQFQELKKFNFDEWTGPAHLMKNVMGGTGKVLHLVITMGVTKLEFYLYSHRDIPFVEKRLLLEKKILVDNINSIKLFVQNIVDEIYPLLKINEQIKTNKNEAAKILSLMELRKKQLAIKENILLTLQKSNKIEAEYMIYVERARVKSLELQFSQVENATKALYASLSKKQNPNSEGGFTGSPRSEPVQRKDTTYRS